VERSAFGSYPAVHPVGRNDQIGLSKLGCAWHFVIVMDIHAEADGPDGQDIQQTLPVDVVGVAPGKDQPLAPEVDNLITPAEGCPLNLAGRFWVIIVKPFQQALAVCDAPAIGHVGLTSLKDRDVCSEVAPLRQK